MNRPRRGVSLLELVIGFAILAIGFSPIFQLFRGTRAVLSTSQEMLMLQNQAMQALAEARGLVASGALFDLRMEEEELLEDTADGVRYQVVLVREEDGAYRLVSRAETESRFFQIAHVVADPYASFHRLEDAPLPEPDDDHGLHGRHGHGGHW